jgi:hypothetical protein
VKTHLSRSLWTACTPVFRASAKETVEQRPDVRSTFPFASLTYWSTCTILSSIKSLPAREPGFKHIQDTAETPGETAAEPFYSPYLWPEALILLNSFDRDTTISTFCWAWPKPGVRP